jgi:sugar lactone lactonase YvrE
VASISRIEPLKAVEGGRVVIHGEGFPVDAPMLVTVGGAEARVGFASPSRIVITVPPDVDGPRTPVRLNGVNGSVLLAVGSPWATGLHQVDNPVFDSGGNLFVTYSGPRGQDAPVSIFRVTRAGTREPFASGIVNATSMAFGPDGKLYVSSRFEGAVYRLDPDGTHRAAASDLGVACGLAFDADGAMYVGDRSGTIFRVRDGAATPFATLPPSVAAFHVAMSPSGDLYVAAPTLSPYDHIFKVSRQGEVSVLPAPFGRPQGLAFGPDGALHVTEALAGSSGIYRLRGDDDAAPELIASGASLVGLAFGPSGEMAVVSNETAYRFD